MIPPEVVLSFASRQCFDLHWVGLGFEFNLTNVRSKHCREAKDKTIAAEQKSRDSKRAFKLFESRSHIKAYLTEQQKISDQLPEESRNGRITIRSPYGKHSKDFAKHQNISQLAIEKQTLGDNKRLGGNPITAGLLGFEEIFLEGC